MIVSAKDGDYKGIWLFSSILVMVKIAMLFDSGFDSLFPINDHGILRIVDIFEIVLIVVISAVSIGRKNN